MTSNRSPHPARRVTTNGGDSAVGAAEPSSSPWAVFAVCAIAIYLTTLDVSIVNVAFPDILTDFGITRASASWIVTIYNIFYASLLVVAGKTADSWGRKRMFRLGVILFGLGSLGAAVAPSLGPLVAGRAIQGIGGAILTPASLGLLVGAFPPERRTQVVSMWGGIGALGVASGPSLGALLIALFDWRAAFWINLPLCVVLVAVSRHLIESPRSSSAHRPDYAGAVLITMALASLALGISQSEAWGWTNARTLGSLTAGIAIIGAFIQRQRRHPEPILDLALFASRSFSTANLSALTFFAGFAALILNNVLFLRQAWGYDVLTAGLLSALSPTTVALCAPFAGRLASRHGFRPFVVAGPLIVAGFALLYTQVFSADRQPGLFVALSILLATGIGAFIPVNTSAAMAELPPTRLSSGGAVNNTFRQVGSVLGISALVAVLGNPTSSDELVTAHHNGWIFIAITMALTSLIGLRQLGASQLRPTPDRK